MKDKRRCERLPAKLEIEVRSGGRKVQCFTRDVSRHGLFVITPTPAAERQLIAMQVKLPNGGSVEVVGSVAHHVTNDDSIRTGSQPGMGIGFFALSGEAKVRWDSYVESLVRATTPKAQAQAAAARSSGRPTFMLRLRDMNRLREFQSRELQQGSMFLKTPVLRTVGDIVELVVINPVTDGEFILSASVTATSKGSPTEPKGMSLRITPLDPDRALAFNAFVAGEEAPPWVEESFQITEGHPEAEVRGAALPPWTPLPDFEIESGLTGIIVMPDDPLEADLEAMLGGSTSPAPQESVASADPLGIEVIVEPAELAPETATPAKASEP